MPTPFNPAQLSPEMAERYGISHRSWTSRIVTYVLALGFALILGFVAFQVTRPGVDFELIAWKVVAPDRTDVTFRVHAKTDEPVTCVVRAQDASRADVGYAIVPVTPVDGSASVTYSLHTAIGSYTAEVLGCGDDPVPGPQFPQGVVPPSQPWTP
jgi:hypothetical protein